MTSAKRWARILIVGASAGVTACSGPTSPGDNSVVTINIVGSNGSQAYTPNPVQVATGATVVLRNYTTVAHHIVMNDGSADFGDIAPSGSSMRRLTTNGGDYHCSIHQTMVGNINGRLPDEPRPCDPAFYDLSHCCDGYYC